MKCNRTNDIVVPGGALSSATCQILSDITGRVIETIEDAKDVGAVGAAILAAVGSKKVPDLSVIKELIPVKNQYKPDIKIKKCTIKIMRCIKRLYKSNKKSYAKLNG